MFPNCFPVTTFYLYVMQKLLLYQPHVLIQFEYTVYGKFYNYYTYTEPF